LQCFLFLLLVLPILILDIGIANWSTNTNIPRISRVAKYNNVINLAFPVGASIRADEVRNDVLYFALSTSQEQSVILSSLYRYPHVRRL